MKVSGIRGKLHTLSRAWLYRLERGFRYYPGLGWLKRLMVVTLVVGTLHAQTTKPVLTSSLIPPWISSGVSLSAGPAYGALPSRRAIVPPWYGIGFRSGGWGSPVYMDTSGMTGGTLHFAFQAQKIRTFAVWLAGDASGAMGALTFRSDTVWKSYDLAWNSLYTKTGSINTIVIQNNGGDSNTVSVADVRFVSRPASAITAPSPPRLRFFGIPDSSRFTGDISFHAISYDSLKIDYAQLFFDSIVVSTLSVDSLSRLKFSIVPRGNFESMQLSDSSTLFLASIFTEGVSLGQHTVWLKVANVGGASNMRPVRIFLSATSHDTAYVSLSAIDSMRIRKNLLAQVPDSLTVQVPKPRP